MSSKYLQIIEFFYVDENSKLISLKFIEKDKMLKINTIENIYCKIEIWVDVSLPKVMIIPVYLDEELIEDEYFSHSVGAKNIIEKAYVKCLKNNVSSMIVEDELFDNSCLILYKLCEVSDDKMIYYFAFRQMSEIEICNR